MLQESIASLRLELEQCADVPRRGWLRVRLADHLAADGASMAAAEELRQASLEAPTRAGIDLAARAIAAHLGGEDAAAFLRACGLKVAEQGAATGVAGAGRSDPAPTRPLGPGPRAARSVEGIPSVPTAASAPHAGSAAQSPQPLLIPPLPLPMPLPAALPPDGPGARPESPVASLLESAVVAWSADRKPVRARQLAEEVARCGGLDSPTMNRLRELAHHMASGGFPRESLLLERTLLEPDGSSPAESPDVSSLLALIDRAFSAGLGELAAAWTVDLGGIFRSSPGAESGVESGVLEEGRSALARFRAAERGIYLARRAEGGEPAWVAPRLAELDLSGVRMPGLIALALAETTVTGTAERALWRRGFEAETDVARRALLATRWVAAEVAARGGDPDEAMLGVLNLAISSIPPASSGRLRRLRAEHLTSSGRLAELAVALGEDAEVASGDARAQRLADQAEVWAELGEDQRALEARLRALSESPGLVRALAPARRQLEAEGRRAESLALAVQAAPLVKSAVERVSLLRQLAALAEAVPGGRRRAATAWLDVLRIDPADVAARAGALRTLTETGDNERLGEFLAWSCAQEDPPTAGALWRLAEFRRVVQGNGPAALAIYRWLVDLRAEDRSAPDLGFADQDWTRQDDALALHSTRALAAPTAAHRARALVDRALLFIEGGGDLEVAERDLARAMDLDLSGSHAMLALERLYERRQDFRGLRQRLEARVGSAGADAGAAAAQLWFGIGRANERLGDEVAAQASYTNAVAADDRFAPALTALRKSAFARGDFREEARILEREAEIAGAQVDFPTTERAALLVELGLVRLEKLGDPAGALAALEAALSIEPAQPRAQQALFEVTLTMGQWERAAEALEAMLNANIGVADAARSYFAVGRAAEDAGRADTALTFYSRSYARMTSYRPTLERLSELCFERQQWDNAWKATEHLLDRHGEDLDVDTRAALAMRAGLADLHIAQRVAATQQLIAMGSALAPSAGASPGIRDVADSWASMRIEPRLLVGIERERRGRILSRLGEVLSLTQEHASHPARMAAREVLAALALVDQRWADALAILEALAADGACDVRRRADFWIAAGDIFMTPYQDMAAAADRYRRAATLVPGHSRLARPRVRDLLGG